MKPKSTLRSVLSIAGTSLLAATLASQAVPISIPNANFELRDTLAASYARPADGATVYFQYAVESWRQFQAAGNGGPIRMWNPGIAGAASSVNNYGYGFGGSAPSGNYVAAVRTRYNDDIAPAQGFTGVRNFEAVVQLLTDTFDPTATYTLTAKVGRLPNLAQGGAADRPWNGYAVQLVAGGTEGGVTTYDGYVSGGTVIAQDNNTLTVAPDAFVTSTVTFTPDPGNPALAALAGQRLQIRLCALEDPSNHATDSYAAFDDITLDFTPPVVSGYAGWKGANAGDQDPGLDFDNDGVENGVEYFMNATAGFTASPALDGTNTITWPNGGKILASAYGTQFLIQTSPDLSTWTDVLVGDLTTNSNGPGGSLTYTLSGAAPRFVRLKVTPN